MKDYQDIEAFQQELDKMNRNRKPGTRPYRIKTFDNNGKLLWYPTQERQETWVERNLFEIIMWLLAPVAIFLICWLGFDCTGAGAWFVIIWYMSMAYSKILQ